ncbi:YqeB family protein [Cytobacillus kochii]|uniref:YqeB family protein n=1 Tax=Cytobacillus kochii TaxID=859143 RepID=UPI00203EEF10|nr:hypothetical protein [Cytobacillus kochii]MCM3324780.1 hypothetical protein [Cytobacillus kochii]MCM3347173.1 hypothetical protein [Cytobacillus kochii]
MKNTSFIGLGFLEKLLVIVSPILLGIIGWFLPRLLETIKRIPLFADSKFIELLNFINPFWLSVIFMFIGVIVGILFSLTIYSEALKMRITSESIHISKDDQEKQITKSNVKAVFVDKRQVVVIDQADREWLREISDINPGKIKDTLLMHSFPWVEENPYKQEYSLWKLEDERFSSSVNTILYERRNAIREGNTKKAKHLRNDLNDLGIFVKDQGEDQYVRSIKQ